MRVPLWLIWLWLVACSNLVSLSDPADTGPSDTPGSDGEASGTDDSNRESGLVDTAPDDSGSDSSDDSGSDSGSDSADDSGSDSADDSDTAPPPTCQDACTDPNTLVFGACPSQQTATCSGPADACTTATCGGTGFTCTNVGGTWRWRTSATCDDGDACSFNDTCLGPGVCAGTTITCTSSTCVTRTCNGTATCAETPLTGTTCNDGNACTFDDRCSAGTCTGTGLSCVSDSCMLRTCNGGPTCDLIPTNEGATCNDGDSCTVGETCSSGTCGGGGPATTCPDGTCSCGETYANCPQDCPFPLPGNACTTGSQNREGCGNARTISRGAAASTFVSGIQNTCNADDDHDGECSIFDVGNDHTWTLFVRAGETVTAELGTDNRDCASGEEYHSRLKFKFNASTSSSGASSCPTFEGCWAGPAAYQTFTTTRSYTATADGWLFIIVDGGASGFDEHRGYYFLEVSLSGCDEADCGC